MARQKGLFKVTGTLGDVNFYVVKGVGYARKAGGGFNGKAIKTKSSMQLVRDNASEFGHCSRVKKTFRVALLPLFDPPKSSTLHRRLMGLFTQLKDFDLVSTRGHRRVAQGLLSPKGKRLLETFRFVPECPATSFILKHCHFEWSTQTLKIDAIDLTSLPFPKGATHLGLTLGVMDFDFEGLGHWIHCSPTVFLEKGSDCPGFALNPEVVTPPTATGLAVLGLQFVEVLEGEVYPLLSMSAFGCGIVGVI